MAFNYYVQPDEMFVATGVSGPAEAGYVPDWLMDTLAGRPVRAGTSGAWTASGTAAEVGLIALVNSRLDSGVTVDFGLGSSVVLPQAGGRPRNPWAAVGPVSNPGSISVAISQTRPLILGELVAGKRRELERPIKPGGRRTFPRTNPQRESIFNSLSCYDYGVKHRVFEGLTSATDAGLAAIEQWFDSCQDRALPTLLVPDPALNDCMYAEFTDWDYTRQGPFWYEVSLHFEEKICKW